MKRIVGKILIIAAAAAMPAYAADQTQSSNLDDLLQKVKQARTLSSQENQQREQEFRADRNEQRAKLQEAKEELQRVEQRSEELKATFDENEQEITELNETLQARLGNLGELFGVVRQVAGDTKGVIDSSLVSAQIPGRGQFISKLSQSKKLPSIDELEQLWFTLQEEMTETGKVVRFSDTVVKADGERLQTDVVRVGVFNAIYQDKYLRYQKETGTLVELGRQPAGRFQSMAESVYNAESGETVAMGVDPTRGQLLSLLIQEPSTLETIQQGELVGYIILSLGALGLLMVLERAIYLTMAGRKIKAQVADGRPNPDNALGRIMGVYKENKDDDVETLELKLDEAILKETPELEARLGAVKIISAVAPLLGLLGTVTGMIETFQQITLFGTGDPKLMAGGISQALVTTMLGLFTAIPLVLLHAAIAGRSKQLVQILEEQSAGIIASHAEKRK